MPTIDLIFVTTGRHPEAEKLICKATGSIYSHAAIRVEIEGKSMIVEAVRPAVRIVPGNCFDDCEVMQIVTLPITEEQRLNVLKRVFELVGKKYGVDDCLIGGVQDVLGERASTILDNWLDNPDTYNCSSTLAELVRGAYPEFAQGYDASKITPEQARVIALRLKETLKGGSE